MLNKVKEIKNLTQRGKVIAEYIWIDKSGITTRSKSRILASEPSDVSDLPAWSYDGSSTGQAVTENSEIVIKPVNFYPDPFRGGDNILVLCDAWQFKDKTRSELIPADTNFREVARKIHEKVQHKDIWLALEQEYTLFHDNGNKETRWPVGWPKGGYPEP